ncbi:hypothetical protein RHO12_03250 [Orbus sturtevantii]|uniref:hypothetical protein n=1 Tax=Orbus sturtevantii TaxID=3074109 RepID=UPI00370D987E
MTIIVKDVNTKSGSLFVSNNDLLSIGNEELNNLLTAENWEFNLGIVKASFSASLKNLELKAQVSILGITVINQVLSKDHPFISIDPNLGIVSGHLGLGFDPNTRDIFIEFHLYLPFGKSVDLDRKVLFRF